jgi:hypothetical protein
MPDARLVKVLNALPGERLVGVHPTIAPVVTEKVADWRRRVNFYTGRALSDRALTLEQNERTGHLAAAGRLLSPGVVRGLEVEIEEVPVPGSVPPQTRQVLHVNPGVAMTASGEDVLVPHRLEVTLAGLGPLPEVSVLVLRPLALAESPGFDPRDPCEIDESEDPFADLLWVDGARLELVPWPTAALGVPPPDGPNRRNQLAYQVFEAERALPRGEVLSWHATGVPLALLVAAGERISFIDRAAVVRAGGLALPRPGLLGRSGSRFLWQARIQQLVEELFERERRNDVAGAATRFATRLPPAGLLPLGAIDRASPGAGFFPPGFVLSTEPAPVEQVEELMDLCAGLEPLDLTQPESVLLLVPVPQAVYEPRLLIDETLSGEFDVKIGEFVSNRAKWLGKRVLLRQISTALAAALDGADRAPGFPNPDPDRLEADETVATPTDAAKDEITYGFEGGKLVALEELKTELGKTATLAVERALLDTKPLREVVSTLAEKLDRADDVLDLGFLRAHTDIYRVRQHVLGETAATRLATSPALAAIAKGTTSVAVREDLTKFFESVKTKPPVVVPPPAPPVAPAPPPSAVTAIAPPSLFIGAASSSQPSPLFSLGLSAPAVTSSRPPSSVSTIGAASTILRNQTIELDSGRLNLGAGGFGVRPGPTATVSQIDIGSQLSVPIFSGSSKADVVSQQPAKGDGYQFRTVSIAERIETPRSIEAKNYSVANRFDLVQTLGSMDIHIDDVVVPGVVKRDANNQPIFNAKTGAPERETKTVSALKSGASGLQILFDDGHAQNADEGSIFSDAISLVDSVVAVLRQVETRVALYRRALEAARRTLVAIEAQVKAANERLEVIDGELAEARHDVATARALKADEEARLLAINVRRATVRAEHVRFYAYVRPRSLQAVVNVPSLSLDPEYIAGDHPACLDRHDAVPAEIQELVAILRESPVGWFAHMPAVAQRLDKLDILHGTIQIATLRASAFLEPAVESRPLTVAARTQGVSDNRFGKALQTLTLANRRFIGEQRRDVARVDLARFVGLGWKQSFDQALQLVTPGDLIEGGHGKTDVADRATRELEGIAQGAACLHERFSAVAPVIRLAWAERLSQFDGEVSLRNLSGLPGFGAIEYLARRELQALVDWLFGRIDARQAGAVKVLNDLVRICLLLASHSPVNQIIAGDLRQPAVAKPGITLPVAVDVAKVRLGMGVVFYKGALAVAHAVVEDLLPEGVSARIVKTATTTVDLAAGTRAHFTSAGVMATQLGQQPKGLL